MIDLTPVFQAFIALMGALVTYKLVPWLKAKLSSEQQTAMLSAVKILVYAAEQIYGAGKGEDKLQYVESELKSRGYEVDRAAIEATVRELSLVDWLGEEKKGDD